MSRAVIILKDILAQLVKIRGLSQNYPEKDYNFFNINGIDLIFYM